MIAPRYIEILVLALAGVLAIFAGSQLVTLPVSMLALVTTLVLVLLWVLLAGDYWWTPVITGSAITGTFWVGFKLFPLEVAIALALLGLAPMLLLRNERLVQVHRRPLPFIFFVAAAYITVRMLVDILPSVGYRGTMTRVYFGAIWPFLFGWFFHYYGRTKVLRAALVVAFVLLILRGGAAIVGSVYNQPLYTPGINYILSLSDQESFISMRWTAFCLLFITLMFYQSMRSEVLRLLLLPVMAFAGYLMVMSAGRFMTLIFLVVPVIFLLWMRRWFLLVFSFIVLVGGLAYLNLQPHVIDEMPGSMGRSLSAFIFKSGSSDIQVATEGSDEWHSLLRQTGLQRWSESPLTILFGYGLRPDPLIYENKQFVIDFHKQVEMSANEGSYESGLWTVLALLGAVGFLLYLIVIFHFWKRIFPLLLRRPRGQLRESVLFWGGISAFLWYANCYIQGSFPTLELFLVILGSDLIDDARHEKQQEEERAEGFPAGEMITAGISKAQPIASYMRKSGNVRATPDRINPSLDAT